MGRKEEDKRLAEEIWRREGNRFSCLIGLDGFVDEVVHAVNQRTSADEYSRISTIREYGERILEGSGLSLNLEIVPIRRKIGGNGPIYADGLKRYGGDLTYIGCVGEEGLHPLFRELAKGSRVIGVADPGQTDAMEFLDGKIIRSKTESLNRLTWEKIIRKVPVHTLAQYFDEADLLSFNNWTMLPHMNRIWERMLAEVLPRMKKDRGEKILFFDLADPRKRKKDDILEALERIRQFQNSGFRTMLGLNEKEAVQICRLLSGDETPGLKTMVMEIAAYMKIETVVVHPVDRAACCQDGEYYEMPGPYCREPVLTTGAGDIFNAGFAWGQVQGLSPEQCLRTGVMSSGFYVRNGRSADLAELCRFMEAKTEEGSDGITADA